MVRGAVHLRTGLISSSSRASRVGPVILITASVSFLESPGVRPVAPARDMTVRVSAFNRRGGRAGRKGRASVNTAREHRAWRRGRGVRKITPQKNIVTKIAKIISVESAP